MLHSCSVLSCCNYLILPAAIHPPAQAIRSDNPIIFFEHVLLYNVKGETTDECQSLEKAEIVREGKDVTIFTYSRMRYVVMQAVAELEKQGYDPEVRTPYGQSTARYDSRPADYWRTDAVFAVPIQRTSRICLVNND